MRIASRFRTLPASAGLVYVITWIVGLAIWPSNLAVTSSSRDVVDAYGAHRWPAGAQFVLVEGLAAVALGVVLLALVRASAGVAPGASRVVLAAATAACCISVAQCGIGVVLVAALASPAHLHAAGRLFDVVNRLDGVKMIALATVIATATSVRRLIGMPTWLAGVGVLAVLALVASGAGYLTADRAWADAASLSLPLLLLWVLATGITLGRHRLPSFTAPAAAVP